MAKILFIHNDTELLKTMGVYLNWYGMETDLLADSSKALARIKENHYDLLIVSAFALPTDGYALCAMLHQCKEDINIMVVAPDEPELKKYLSLKKMNAHFMNEFEDTLVWYKKIITILQKQEAKTYEKE